MRIVLDTNVLITYFWEGSAVREIMQNKELMFFTSQKALQELLKYKKHVMKKARITSKLFDALLDDMKMVIPFVPNKEYSDKMAVALKISPDKDDAEFIALAMKLKCPLWSNDKALSNIKTLQVITTHDVIRLLVP
ncbi:MAG: PIN domain-containing protein [Candidatus Woesearchaeota archaeon]